eukprot:14864679-Ditylum_brightwellii.AAC.1
MRPRCHPGEGKKWACEPERCTWEPVCNTAHMGRVEHCKVTWPTAGLELSTQYNRDLLLK